MADSVGLMRESGYRVCVFLHRKKAPSSDDALSQRDRQNSAGFCDQFTLPLKALAGLRTGVLLAAKVIVSPVARFLPVLLLRRFLFYEP